MKEKLETKEFNKWEKAIVEKYQEAKEKGMLKEVSMFHPYASKLKDKEKYVNTRLSNFKRKIPIKNSQEIQSRNPAKIAMADLYALCKVYDKSPNDILSVLEAKVESISVDYCELIKWYFRFYIICNKQIKGRTKKEDLELYLNLYSIIQKFYLELKIPNDKMLKFYLLYKHLRDAPFKITDNSLEAKQRNAKGKTMSSYQIEINQINFEIEEKEIGQVLEYLPNIFTHIYNYRKNVRVEKAVCADIFQSLNKIRISYDPQIAESEKKFLEFYRRYLFCLFIEFLYYLINENILDKVGEYENKNLVELSLYEAIQNLAKDIVEEKISSGVFKISYPRYILKIEETTESLNGDIQDCVNKRKQKVSKLDSNVEKASKGKGV